MATFALVHGAWHGAWCWEKLTPLLRQAGHDVVAPDLPIDDNTASFDTYADVACAAVDECSDDLILVGHSYGGLLARLFAERHPEKVGGLVLVDPVLGCEWAHPGKAQDALRVSAVKLTRVGEWLARFGVVRLASSPAVLRSGIIPKLATSHQVTEGVLSRLTAEIVKLPREIVPVFRSHWCRAKNFRALTVHLRELPSSFAELREARLDCPEVVISADNPSDEGLAEHRAIAALSARGEHVIAEGSGHWVQFDRPDLVVAAIRRVVRAAR